MNGYWVDVTCPTCGGTLEPVDEQQFGGTHVEGVMLCHGCADVFVAVMRLYRRAPQGDCGTVHGWMGHKGRKEPACFACAMAWERRRRSTV